jgi:hypothetical protein
VGAVGSAPLDFSHKRTAVGGNSPGETKRKRRTPQGRAEADEEDMTRRKKRTKRSGGGGEEDTRSPVSGTFIRRLSEVDLVETKRGENPPGGGQERSSLRQLCRMTNDIKPPAAGSLERLKPGQVEAGKLRTPLLLLGSQEGRDAGSLGGQERSRLRLWYRQKEIQTG